MEQLDINQHNDDTICAVSTPAGVGGIAVVRVSGRDAVKCVMKSWRGADLNAVQTHTLHLGRIVDTDGETLDEVWQPYSADHGRLLARMSSSCRATARYGCSSNL